MRVYQELIFRGSEQRCQDAIELITKSLSGGWVRDKATEERIKEADELWYCFRCSRTESRRDALLSLTRREDGAFYVPNIVPTESGRLTYAQYNGIISEFYERFARPAATTAGITVELTPPEADLEAWLSGATAAKLRRFSAAANKVTGRSHPSDQKHWNDFLVAAHKEGSKLDPSTLRRWLVESAEWPEDVAHELAIEYECARDM